MRRWSKLMKTVFQTASQISDPDRFYEALLNAHQGLSAAQSEALNARIILVLANQIGDTNVLIESIQSAAVVVSPP